jgi:hypothetical protein
MKWVGKMDDKNFEWQERAKTNTRNLDDLIHYLEYRKNTGYPAARVDFEQEEYWAMLLRRMLMKEVINNLVPFYDGNTHNKLTGIKFTCSNCGYRVELRYTHNEFNVGKQDDYEIGMHCNCGLTKAREEDIKEYLGYMIDEWNKPKRHKHE